MSDQPSLPGRLVLLAVLLPAAELVLAWTGSLLPVHMASHFTAAGHADGSGPRAQYLLLMAALLAVMPMMTLLACWAATSVPSAFVNIPNRDYWLAPERRAVTRRRLLVFAADLAVLQAVFLLVVHLWVVMANLGTRTPGGWLWLAALFLVVALGIHIVGLIRYFRTT